MTRLAKIHQLTKQNQSAIIKPLLTGVVKHMSQVEFENKLNLNSVEAIFAPKCSQQELEQIIEMPSVAHVCFFVEMIKYLQTDLQKLAIIDKICLMTTD